MYRYITFCDKEKNEEIMSSNVPSKLAKCLICLLSSAPKLADLANVYMMCPGISGHPIKLHQANSMKTIYSFVIQTFYNESLLE